MSFTFATSAPKLAAFGYETDVSGDFRKQPSMRSGGCNSGVLVEICFRRPLVNLIIICSASQACLEFTCQAIMKSMGVGRITC